MLDPVAVPFRLPDNHVLLPGRGVSIRSGRDALLIAYGPVMLSQAFLAAESLAERHALEVEVVNLPWLNEVDSAWLARQIGARSWLFTLDDHLLAGGQGQLLAATVAELGLPGLRVERIGVEGIPACGTHEQVLRHHALDADSVCTRLARRLAEEPTGPQLRLRRA